MKIYLSILTLCAGVVLAASASAASSTRLVSLGENLYCATTRPSGVISLLKRQSRKYVRTQFISVKRSLTTRVRSTRGRTQTKYRRVLALVTRCETSSIQAAAAHAQPTPTPTPTDLCLRENKRFLWNVNSVAPQPAFNLTSMPHMEKNIVLLNLSWYGALPTILDPSTSQTGRIAWLQIPSQTINGKIFVNSGTPLYADTAAHDAAMRRHITAVVPDPQYSGYIVFDFEQWMPSWDFTIALYQNEAIAQYKARNPGLTDAEALARTKTLWQQRATEMFLQTIQVTKELRPKAKLGWYELVWRAYWDGYASPSGNALRAGNDVSLPAQRAMDFVVSSIYQFYRSGVDANGLPLPYPPGGGYPPNGSTYYEMNRRYVQENITEAKRLAAAAGGKPVMTYSWARYHNSATAADRYQLVTAGELFLQSVYPLMLGADIVTFWGNEESTMQNPAFGALQPYIDTMMAPMFEGYCKNDLGKFAPLVGMSGL